MYYSFPLAIHQLAVLACTFQSLLRCMAIAAGIVVASGLESNAWAINCYSDAFRTQPQSCSSTSAAHCVSHWTQAGSCQAAGYTGMPPWGYHSINDDEDQFSCPAGPGCGYVPPPAQVPELEDYAAAAFLVIALTIGWRVRRVGEMKN